MVNVFSRISLNKNSALFGLVSDNDPCSGFALSQGTYSISLAPQRVFVNVGRTFLLLVPLMFEFVVVLL